MHDYGQHAARMLRALRSRGLLNDEAFAAHLRDATGSEIHASLVSQWVSGACHLPASVLPHLADFTGRPDLVYSGFVRTHGWHVAPDESTDTGGTVRSLAELSVDVAGAVARRIEAHADGKVTAEEERALAEDVERILGRVLAERAALRVAR